MEFLLNPLVIQLVGVMVAAFLAFLGGQYVVKPRRCDVQRKECQKAMSELALNQNKERNSNKKDVADSFDDIKVDLHDIQARVDKMVEKADSVYVRRDVVIPQLNNIQNEISALRSLIFRFLKLNGHGE